jgi:hypothetical protein
MNFFNKKTPEQKQAEKLHKQKLVKIRNESRRKEELRLAKQRGKRDATKNYGSSWANRLGGAVNNVGNAIDTLNKGSDKLAESMFGPNAFKPVAPEHAKRNKKVKRRVTEYF